MHFEEKSGRILVEHGGILPNFVPFHGTFFSSKIFVPFRSVLANLETELVPASFHKIRN